MRAKEFIIEAETYQPPELAVGDKILKGKFKNSPAEIKGFTKDKHNQPVLKTNKGEVQLFKPRVSKLMKEEINPDCFNPAFNDTQEFDELTYRATVEEEYGKPILSIRVLDNFQMVGLAKFKQSNNSVESLITSIKPDYQGKGIARNIYAYVRMLGNTIKPSQDQLPPGKAMWKSWKKSGDAPYLMKEDAGNTTTLAQLYGGNYPDRDETFWDYVSQSELDKPLSVQTMQRHLVPIMLLSQYRAEHIDDITDMLDDEQQEIVQSYVNDPVLSSKIIVVADNRIIDGNHRALAAAIKGVPINYVDLSDLDGEEVVDEMAGSVHGGIRKVLKDKGYKYLGGGVDKQAWLEPGTGQVLLVFGYRKGFTDFSPDQRMFIDWINFCNTNRNNPNLPKFSGFESFKFQGNNYIQARMEPLQDIPSNLTIKRTLPWLDEYIRMNKEVNVSKIAKKLGEYWVSIQDPKTGKLDNRPQKAEEVIDSFGGAEAAAQLMRTVQQVKQFGKQHKFSLDLHGDNYMQRADGTIVVNDPFVLWIEK